VARSFEIVTWYRDALDAATIGSAPAPIASGLTPAPPAASSAAGHRLATPTIGPRADGGTPEPAEERLVRFSVFPPSALLQLDGQDLPDTHGVTRKLKVGSRHVLRTYLAPPLPCCEASSETTFSVVVAPENAKNPEQEVTSALKTRPGLLRSDGPAGFQVRCPTLPLAVSPAKGLYSIEIPGQLDKHGTCYLLDGSQNVGSQEVRLKAGETTTVSWSLGPKN
jgi:hypothetical protein